jgi:hypothetical protein
VETLEHNKENYITALSHFRLKAETEYSGTQVTIHLFPVVKLHRWLLILI